MRIGIDARLISAFGIGSYIRGLLSGLVMLPGDEQYVVFVPERERHRVPSSLETIVTETPPYSLVELVQMGRLATRASLDLFHVPHFVVPFVRRGIGCRIVTTLFDAIPFHYPLPNPFALPYIAWMMQHAANRADRILTISHAARRDLLEVLDCPSEKISVTSIGIGDQFFQPPGDRKPGRYFVFAGKIARHKNVETLLDAFAIVRRADPSLRLVLTGGNHERFAGRDGVTLSGFVDDAGLIALYRDALAVILPSFMEGFGLPALEAMALGTPAITSTAAALLEVTGDDALHADPHSAKSLAAAMQRLAGDPVLWAELSVRGRMRARTYTWSACAWKTREIYREVVGSSHR